MATSIHQRSTASHHRRSIFQERIRTIPEKTPAMSTDQIRLIQLPKILDERGNLSFFENEQQVPFKIARLYWIYDVPGGKIRGGHAYKTLRERSEERRVGKECGSRE